MSDRDAQKMPSPALVPSFLIAVGGRVLPGGSRRDRYRQEFLAELYGMSRGQQTVHALQIVASLDYPWGTDPKGRNTIGA